MRVTSKGQVTIPQEIRDKYGFLPRQRLRLSRRASGSIS